MKVFIFSLYSWLTRIGWGLLDLCPPFIRKIVFKCCLASMGKSCLIDYGVYIRYMNKMSVGDRVSINRGCRFFGSHFVKDARITIGSNVAIGPECCFFSAGHEYKYVHMTDNADSITVGDNVWICGRCVILQGVTIGEGAVIAAGSVVTKDVAPYTIAGGCPAVYIKDRIIENEEE